LTEECGGASLILIKGSIVQLLALADIRQNVPVSSALTSICIWLENGRGIRKEIDMKQLNETTYDELCKTLTDFENATDDTDDEDYLSDGEWLDVFYDLCVKIQREMN